MKSRSQLIIENYKYKYKFILTCIQVQTASLTTESVVN